ncbi:hypothetical protein LMG28690_03459 [Paraburkholderia caffeinilytica]|nr:hypothetical protein LMG28690_03459 [Paraburkholderia caffeinilytica]
MRTLQSNQYSQGVNFLPTTRSRPAALCGHLRNPVCGRSYLRVGAAMWIDAIRQNTGCERLGVPERFHHSVFCLF